MPPKRHKSKNTIAPKKARGSRGMLENIQNLPLDVVHEIFGYLHPQDLLRLSRTTKTIRKFVLDKSAAHAWRKARERSDVPEIIPTTSEPVFASLLFDTHCWIGWHALTRCCKKCQRKYFASYGDLRDLMRDLPSPLVATIPKFVSFRQGSQNAKIAFSIEATEEIHNEYISIPLGERENWVQGKVEEDEKLFKPVDACMIWDMDRKEAREAEIEAIREERYDDIAIRLIESGWHPAVVQSSIFRGSGYVKGTHPQPITDAVWKNLHPSFERMRDFYENCVRGDQATARYYLLDEYLEEFRKQLPLGLVMPHTDIIALFEPFQTIIEDSPITSKVKLKISQGRRLDLLQKVQSWNEFKTGLLLEKLQEHRPEATKGDLDLCSTLFRCPRCPKAVYTYPAILSHRCHTMSTINWRERLSGGGNKKSVPNDLSVQKLELYTEANAVTEGIGLALGMPLTGMRSELMLRGNPMVQCVDCTKEDGSRVFMRWSAAINSVNSHTPEHTRYLPVSQFDRMVVHTVEYGSVLYWFGRRKDWFVCKRCERRDDLIPLEEHISEEHGVTGKISREDYDFRPLEATFFIGPDPVELGR
ncbi:hypothetical protein PM082_004368 [Marasmius tenuissimus]|nr:hypothetical protein PM082_004368 [Marasmius tenuissimus]